MIEIFSAAKDAVQIQRNAVEGVVRVSWPVETTNQILERASAVGEPADWLPVESTPVVEGRQFVFTMSSIPTSTFFRLRGANP